MSLKFKYQKREDVPAELAAHYVERDGNWALDAEGAVDRAKLDEFRSVNSALARERDELKKRFEGIDPDEVRRLRAATAKLEEDALHAATARTTGVGAGGTGATTPAEVEKILEGRVKAVRGELDKQISNLTSERDALNQRLANIQIDQGITQAATKRGLRATAFPDIIARARNVFRLVQGAPVVYESDGQTVRAGKDGFTPMTVEEWIDCQVSEAPHLFEGNAGAGAGGTVERGTGRVGMRNPWRKETWNLTEQMKLQRADPQLAARLKGQA